jgi:hypothetical protein
LDLLLRCLGNGFVAIGQERGAAQCAEAQQGKKNFFIKVDSGFVATNIACTTGICNSGCCTMGF